MLNKSAKSILNLWCKSQGLTPGKLAEATGWSYNTAWCLMRHPKYKISDDAIGRLLRVYGCDGPAPDMAAAMKNGK